ncbi:NACHT, LRR and PYD domains-containing protein 3-like isoform X2 [Ctenopharyngodon idella]|uniref:NACHT, LRR and PYD domains-containing protein 3-like isoform X2 n=1 Tax=Ctenopharyngodon idella TaxID=7959 RepID=UPI0022320924|nr:NACHT, LRR and PYD domains-containing protein 3-like isoform X2 [Ctenopharyngodon idella]
MSSPSPETNCASLKSDQSMMEVLLEFSYAVTPDPRKETYEPITSLPLSTSHYQTHIRQDQTEAVLQTHTLETGDLQRVKVQHRTSMKNKYERLFEGNNLQDNETLLNRIYTQLYIIEGERERVNEEHEVLQIEKTDRTQDTPIYCNDVFKASPEQGCEEKDQIKTVLTKGIAGIGKTVSVQKFVLDWAEGKANQDVDFMFVLPFRDLNLIRDDQYSLYRLLLDFYPELQDVDSEFYEECKVVFIFDGLDESRITLFSDSAKVSDVTETSSVGVLISNLMKGELLPSALIWITSRPAAANQIPSKYINRQTEIQGFNEPQKEEYFRKRISDEHQVSKIISHIRRARSLHIMCHIPVFCWISATVLKKLLEKDLSAEIPHTLTEMYIHFLLIQINMRNQKYEERDPEKLLKSNREVIMKLAEVAFKQLMKGNVTFYEEDLRESGIDVTNASVYSGICTEIFKEESLINQRKVYSFIHLSIQEFLAAFHVFYCYLSTMESLKVVWFSLDHGGHLRVRPGLRKYACDLTLDPNTAHTQLSLSEGGKKATYEEKHQPYPYHPERFVYHEQVLCRESLTGRCYWEVTWVGTGHVAVTYKEICRNEGSDCRIGRNEKSWSVYFCDNFYTFWHNNKNTTISSPSPSSDILGVYLDRSAGTLSFYSVSNTNTLTHLHTFNSTFTGPLYAGFVVYPDSSVKFNLL